MVTHHATSLQSVPENFRADSVTSAYASNVESFIVEHEPLFWIHGYIDIPSKYKIGEKKIICNPHNYVTEKYNGFEKS